MSWPAWNYCGKCLPEDMVVFVGDVDGGGKSGNRRCVKFVGR